MESSLTIGSLWLPILLSSVAVFFASFLNWVVLPTHKKDFSAVSDEEATRKALSGLAPGQYNLPHYPDMNDLKKPEAQKKFNDGPVAFITVLPNGIPNMGKNMGMIFVFYVVVSVFAAYVATRTLDASASYLSVFRLVGTVTFLAHGMGIVQDAVWFGRPWSAVWKQMGDSLIYALLTGGFFGWLWA